MAGRSFHRVEKARRPKGHACTGNVGNDALAHVEL